MPRKKKEVKLEPEKTEVKEVAVKKTSKKTNFFHGTGRRKTAVARIFLWEEKGEFTVNEAPANDFFKTEVEQGTWTRPFHLIGVSHPKSKFRGSIKVRGSGRSSQIEAVTHAVSRALASMSEENRAVLAKAGLLRRDPRMVERKKYFLHKARKRPQYSKR